MKTHRGHNCDISGSLKTNAISQLLSPLVFTMIFIYGCGGGGGALNVAPPPAKTYVQASQKNEFPIGGGVISPYKILEKKISDGNILVINGGGESGGAGHIFHVDADTFAETRTRLDIGANPSDIIWVGNNVVVSCRGSNELYLIDVNNWRIMDSTTSITTPTSMAELPGNRFVVIGPSSYIMRVYEVSNGAFKQVISSSIASSYSKIVADSSGSYVYATATENGTVSKLNAKSLSLVAEYKTGGSPSFGGLIINNNLYVTDRDGYIHNINLLSGKIQTIDLAISLSLDRASLPLRGIEPMDIVKLNDETIAVINGRQKSVVLSLDRNGNILQAPRSLLAGGIRGTYLAGFETLIITKPTGDSITKHANINASNPSKEDIKTGSRIKSGALLSSGDNKYMATMSSNATLSILNLSSLQETIIPPPPGFSWHYDVKLSSYNNQSFAAIAVDGVNSQFYLVIFDALGTELFGKTLLNRNSVFSIEFVEDAIIVVSRMYNKVEIVNVKNGTSQEVVLEHPRPREAVAFDNGDWAVVHDTNPDIGYSFNHQNRTNYFPLDISGWPSDILMTSETTVVISSFSSNFLYCISPNTNKQLWTMSLPFDKVEKLVSYSTNSFWAVSPTSGVVAHIDASDRQIAQMIFAPSAIDVLPDYSNNGFWIVTEERLIQYEYDI